MTRVFLALGLVAILAMPAFAGGFLALAGSGGVAGDAQTSIVYDSATGTVSIDTPNDVNLTSINVDSASCGFIEANFNAAEFTGSFDTKSTCNFFKATFGGEFGDFTVGDALMAPGLTADAVVADLTAQGSKAGGGDLGPVDLVYLGGGGPPPAGDYKTYPEGIDDEQTSLVYWEETGTLEVNAPKSTELSSINVNSAGSKFIEANYDAAQFTGSFDTKTTGNFFKATFGSSFPSFVVGQSVMPAGMTPAEVLADLHIGAAADAPTGSLNGGGGLGVVDLIYAPVAIPEPSSLILLGLGLLGLAVCRRR